MSSPISSHSPVCTRCEPAIRASAFSRVPNRRIEWRARDLEGSEKSVACGVHLASAESAEFLSQQIVVGAEQFVPSMVAEPSSALCRSHDIGEHNAEVLREYLGYSPDQIGSLEREGILLRGDQ
jgi:hypothetical protein